MGKKSESTPRNRVKNALRLVWLHSRERAKALKSTGHRCARCGVKASTAKGREVKLEVHHNPPITWDGIVDIVFKQLLNVPQEPLCKACHQKEHEKEKTKGLFDDQDRKI